MFTNGQNTLQVALKSSSVDDPAHVAQMNHPVSIKLVTILTNWPKDGHQDILLMQFLKMRRRHCQTAQ